MEISPEQLKEFTTNHLIWIHQVECMANRRLTDHEILCLRDMEIVNNWDARLVESTELISSINESTANFVEGIVPNA